MDGLNPTMRLFAAVALFSLTMHAAVQPVTFNVPRSFPAPGGNYAMALGDFNGDGKPDAAVATQSGVSILPGDGQGNFGAPINTSLHSSSFLPTPLAAADFNGDGKLDLVVASSIEHSG